MTRDGVKSAILVLISAIFAGALTSPLPGDKWNEISQVGHPAIPRTCFCRSTHLAHHAAGRWSRSFHL